MTRRSTTLADVAKQARVSRSVAGFVLNGGRGNTRVGTGVAERVILAASELGYRPNLAAMLLRGKRSFTYGLLVESAGDPLRAFLVQHLDAAASARGCRLVIGNTGTDAGSFGRCLEDFAQRKVDGIISVMHRLEPQQFADLTAACPHAVIYGAPGDAEASVVPDLGAAAGMAVAHLLERGSERIGLIQMTTAARLGDGWMNGYRHGLARGGIGHDPGLEHIGDCARYYFAWGRSREELAPSLDEAIDRVVVRARADGLLVQNDFWASLLISRLRERGILVPDRIRLIGYLNHHLCEWTDPPLSTIDPNHQQAAESLVALLEQRIEGKGPAGPFAIPPILVGRRSSMR